MPSLLTKKEAAQVLRICVRKLQRLTVDGEVQAIRIGRSVRYAESDLQAFILKCKGENGAR